MSQKASHSVGGKLPKEEIDQLARIISDDFKQNSKCVKHETKKPKMASFAPKRENLLQQPAFQMLGLGGSHFGPMRSKALSMQVNDSVFQAEERKEPSRPAPRQASPEISPCKKNSVRSLLLEPDMEDLTSIMPLPTDI